MKISEEILKQLSDTYNATINGIAYWDDLLTRLEANGELTSPRYGTYLEKYAACKQESALYRDLIQKARDFNKSEAK